MIQLRKLGHEIFCIMASWGSQEFEEMLREENIGYVRLRLGFISKTLDASAIKKTLHQAIHIPSLWWKYKSLLKRIGPDVVIHTNFHHIFILFPVLGNAIQVFYVHDFFPASSFFIRLFALFNRKMNLFIGVSNFIVKSLNNLSLPHEKIVLLSNGISPPTLDKSLMNVDGVIRIGIIGQIGEWKGHELLINAISPILLNRRDVELHIIGDGDNDYIEKLKEIVQRSHLSSKLPFVGN